MTRLASWVLLALVTALGLAGPAGAAPQDPTFTLKVDRHVVRSGQTLTATATAKVVCDWILEWNGERKHVRAKTFTTTFVVPTVSKRTKVPLRGTCVVAAVSGTAGAARAAAQPDGQVIVVRVPPHSSHTVPVTVLPPGGEVSPPGTGTDGGVGGAGTGNGLPNTGGPALWLLAAGLGALLAGSVVVRRAQHR